MARTAKYIKVKLIEHMNNMRTKSRCALVRKIVDAFHSDNAELYNKRDTALEEYHELDRQKALKWKEYTKYSDEISKAKTAANIRNTGKVPVDSCSISTLLPALVDFDAETTKFELMIMEADEITLDDVNTMIGA